MTNLDTQPREPRPLCELLEWDTAFFGFPIARLSGPPLTREAWLAVRRWCGENRIRCLYLLASVEDLAGAEFLIGKCDFRLVDIRATLERDASPTEPGGEIRLAQAADVPALAAIARESHTDSRFYRDPHFPRERCDALYQTWLEKSCAGWADAVLVAEYASRPAGYITCKLSEGEGQIGLIAVASWARGAGIGRRLVLASVRTFAQNGARRVRVVTQGRNMAAQRLYQRCGFTTCSLQLWYHRWFTGAPEPDL
jgi:dTDP-4-amino-4,6-dideoxy-D-galactose acyltransferase